MKVGFVGLHYPHAKHRQEFLSRAQQAVEILRTAPGCLSADSWTTANGEVVVTTGQWESQEAASASFAAAKAAGADFDYDQRESRPRDVYWLVSA